MSMDGPPVVQMFADELMALILKYRGSGLSNAECIGTLHMADIDLIIQAREDGIRGITDIDA